MNRNNNIAVMMAVTFSQSLVFAYIVERLFWELRGMTVRDVVYTEFIYVGLVFLLEIPAGIIADRGSRKLVLLTAALLRVLEFVIVVLATRFAHFTLAVAVGALTEVLESGTRNALIYESLVQTGDERRFTRVIGRLGVIDNTTTVVALLCGGFLAEHLSMELLYWLAAAGSALAAAMHLFLREVERVGPRRDNVSDVSDVSDVGDGRDAEDGPAEALPGHFRLPEIRDGLRLFVADRRLLTAAVAAIAVSSSIVYLDEFLTLHARDLGMPVWSFGLLLGAAYLARSTGAVVAERLENAAERDGFFGSAVFAFLTAQVLFAFSGIGSGVAIVVFLYLTWGALDVLSVSRIHHAADSSFRATAESIASQGERIAALVFGLVFAAAARWLSIAGSVAVTALAAAAVYGAFAITQSIGRRSRR